MHSTPPEKSTHAFGKQARPTRKQTHVYSFIVTGISRANSSSKNKLKLELPQSPGLPGNPPEFALQRALGFPRIREKPRIDSAIYQTQSSNMSEVPEAPQPVPKIPAMPLWSTIAIPPIATVSAGILILGLRNLTFDINVVQVILPLLASFGLLVLFGVIPGLAFHFHDAVRPRYRGRSLGFLVVAYILGEFIVCLALGIGSCFVLSITA